MSILSMDRNLSHNTLQAPAPGQSSVSKYTLLKAEEGDIGSKSYYYKNGSNYGFSQSQTSIQISSSRQQDCIIEANTEDNVSDDPRRCDCKLLVPLCELLLLKICTVATALVLVLITLLCVLIVRTGAKATELTGNLLPTPGWNQQSNYGGYWPINQLPNANCGDKEQFWRCVEHDAKFQTRIHFRVSHENVRASQMTMVTETGGSEVIGRPDFCTKSRTNIGKLRFENVSKVILSDMNGCWNYVSLILSEWSFPAVIGLKLTRMAIREPEFLALTKFIERHNETLTEVDIEDCFLCHGSACDAGMIEFPDHNFRLSISKRRWSSEGFL